MSLSRFFIPLFLLLVPSISWGSTLVLSPLFPSGVDNKAIMNLHQLVEAELEFAPGLDQVKGLPTRPRVLGPNCLQTPSCLSGLARAHGGTLFLSGILSSKGSSYGLDLVLYDLDKNQIVRRKSWTVPRDPTELANGITPILAEILTGKNPNEEDTVSAVAAEFEDDSLEDDESLDFDAADLVVAAPPEPAPEPEAAVDLSAISFGGSASDITTEDLAQIQFGPAPTSPTPAASDYGVAGGVVGGVVPEPTVSAPVIDLDSDPIQTRRPRVKPTGSSTGQASPSLSIRGGFSNYYKLNFVTVGVEGSYPLTSNLHVVAGMESYLVRRMLTSDIQPAGLSENQTGTVMYQWQSILPFNVGALYRLDIANVKPYAGLDIITAQYFKNEAGADWTLGARARFGVDLPVSSLVHLNVNGALGIWGGPTWAYIEQGVGNSGLIPQLSAGTTIPF